MHISPPHSPPVSLFLVALQIQNASLRMQWREAWEVMPKHQLCFRTVEAPWMPFLLYQQFDN